MKTTIQRLTQMMLCLLLISVAPAIASSKSAISSIAVGGTLYSTMDSKLLNYPIGVADMEKLFGIKFNMKEYDKIAKYIYRGDQDQKDYTEDWDKNGEDYVGAIRKLFKDETQPYKWNRKIDIMDDLGYNGNYQYHTYIGAGHNITANIYDDIVEFFKVNKGDQFNKITPHEYAE